ncbi:MAG: hypothetical protein HOK28_01930 [Deltaproteobacteria bacterium]|jgi:class 3 adenylate cyclase|nr:hypothetical protein [Opitutae bacterium]MBT6200538.1 hypothetical protein [Bacteroidetes Order II. bacterium]MBT6431819.1 hypothetical protein [Deltaproteobacteria bacterium]
MRNPCLKIKRCLLLVFLVCCAQPATAATPVFTTSTNTTSAPLLGRYLQVLEDTTGNMTVNDVMAAHDKFTPIMQDFPSLGFKRNPHWFHVQITGDHLSDEIYLLHVDYAFLDELTFFEIHEGTIIQKIHTGDGQPFRSRPVDYETFLFPLKLKANQTSDIYFRVKSTESILFPLQLFSREQERKTLSRRNHIYGGLFGAIILIVVYNLLLWMVLRDRSHLLYWIYLLTQAVFQFIYSGYAFRYWWPDHPEFQVASIVMIGALTGLLGFEFCREYLDTRKLLPRSDRYINIFEWVIAITIPLIFAIDQQWAVIAVSMLALVVPISILCLVFRLAIYERLPSAIYIFFAFSTLIIAFCITGISALGWLEFTEFTLHMPPLSVVIEGTLLSLGLAHRIRTLQNEKAHTLELLLEESTRAARMGASAQRFVPHEFLEFLGHTDISQVGVGDSMAADMTVLFSDIRSFTSLSENMTPKQNFEFVNEYLQTITPVIYKHGGFVDKFIGDAVMALFHKSADDACRCALKMQEALSSYNATRRERDEPEIKSGIGIHTGSVMLGTVGDEKRLQTTVISDAVNLASRIEGLTKDMAQPILISQGVVNALEQPTSLDIEKLHEVRVKGKNEQVIVYALNGSSEAESS